MAVVGAKLGDDDRMHLQRNIGPWEAPVASLQALNQRFQSLQRLVDPDSVWSPHYSVLVLTKRPPSDDERAFHIPHIDFLERSPHAGANAAFFCFKMPGLEIFSFEGAVDIQRHQMDNDVVAFTIPEGC